MVIFPKEYKGQNGNLILTDTSVVIKRGLKGFLLGGGMLRGDKTIPYSSITAVQFKKSGLLVGYLQLTLKGGLESRGGVMQSQKDENTVRFTNNINFLEAKEIIEEKMSHSSATIVNNNGIDDLQKLADLKEKGIITDEEFSAKKKQILNL